MSDDLVNRLCDYRIWNHAHHRYDAVPVVQEAVQAITEAQAEIERLEAQVDEALRSCLAEREGRLKAESELSTLRARVREVVGPFGDLAQQYDDTVSDGWIPWVEFIADYEWPTEPDCRTARQLMEEVK